MIYESNVEIIMIRDRVMPFYQNKKKEAIISDSLYLLELIMY